MRGQGYSSLMLKTPWRQYVSYILFSEELFYICIMFNESVDVSEAVLVKLRSLTSSGTSVGSPGWEGYGCVGTENDFPIYPLKTKLCRSLPRLMKRELPYQEPVFFINAKLQQSKIQLCFLKNWESAWQVQWAKNNPVTLDARWMHNWCCSWWCLSVLLMRKQ